MDAASSAPQESDPLHLEHTQVSHELKGMLGTILGPSPVSS